MAIHTYAVPGVSEPLALRTGFWRPHLLQGGVEVDRANREYQVALADGRTVPARFQRVLLGFDIPDLVVDGTAYSYAPRLPVWVAVWCFLPIALVVAGGAIPGLIGCVAAIGNLRVMRTQASAPMKALASLGLTVAAVIVVLLIASLLRHLFRT
jgi:hypothetical protein